MSDELLKACDLYAKTSRGVGQREYMIGYMGAAKVLIFKVHDPKTDGPTHAMFFAERKPRQERRPASEAERGRATAEATQDRADAWTHQQRDAHVQELAERLGVRLQVEWVLLAFQYGRVDCDIVMDAELALLLTCARLEVAPLRGMIGRHVPAAPPPRSFTA
jgi:hypothetical protein